MAEAANARLGNIFQYTDYREYLRDDYVSKKQKKVGWSLETWARSLGIKSKSTLAMILNGQRHPGRMLVTALVQYFRLTTDEAEYFYDLVEWRKADEAGGTNAVLLERLAKKRARSDSGVINLDTFASMSSWFFPAIRVLYDIEGFRLDPHWISHQLHGNPNPNEVREALLTLSRLKLLEQIGGQFVPVGGNLVTESERANRGLKQFHEQVLHKAAESLHRDPVEEREFRAMTFAIRERELPKAKRVLREWMDEFADAIEASPGDRVYQLEVCFFPLSRKRSHE